MGATESLRSTLSDIRKTWSTVVSYPLSDSEVTIVNGIFAQVIARGERRLAKVLAKAAAQVENETTEAAVAAEGADTTPDEDAALMDSAAQASAGHSSTSSIMENANGSASTGKPRPGHGRNGAGAYARAAHCHHVLPPDILGALCDACGIGRMSRYREKLTVVIKGQPLFGAETHHFEQARCKLCGAILRADGKRGPTAGLGSGYITYDWSACAMLLVMHYFAGMPFKRLESLQAGWGIPMADANQWQLADTSADLLLPLYKALERHGIQNALALRIDDTGSKVIGLQREILAEIAVLKALGEPTTDVRTGINATGVYLDTEQGRVLLFFTGRHHAGEMVDRLLQHRHPTQGSGDKLIKVTDAASKNFSHAHQTELEEAVCNAHAYLKFRAVKGRYPEEYAVAGEVYNKVFEHDDVAKGAGLSPSKRMRYHREHSLPKMRRLLRMCKSKLESGLVEPNSPLWEPLTFIINQWQRLTRFCHVPGVPLDTNVVEQMLIIPVRYLAGSFNYKTLDGADVGDRHMSLIATANANGIEPVAYLTACLQNHKDLAQRPEHYLPWVYRERLQAQARLAQRCVRRSAPELSSVQSGVKHPLRPGRFRGPVTETGPRSVPSANT